MCCIAYFTPELLYTSACFSTYAPISLAWHRMHAVESTASKPMWPLPKQECRLPTRSSLRLRTRMHLLNTSGRAVQIQEAREAAYATELAAARASGVTEAVAQAAALAKAEEAAESSDFAKLSESFAGDAHARCAALVWAMLLHSMRPQAGQ